MVGDVFGYAATRTPGSLAIAALVAARRADVVAVALRGPCPGGRVFAAQALLSGDAGPATADDRCTVWDTTVAELLAETPSRPRHAAADHRPGPRIAILPQEFARGLRPAGEQRN